MAQFAGVNYTVDGREPVTAEEFGVIGAHCANTEQYDAAAVFLGRAEELGDQEAMVRLGDLYLDGLLRCTRAPLEHALEHLTYASNLGHPYAQFRIAELYRTYYRDDATAARFYQACLANPRRASHTLGRLMTSVSEAQLASTSSSDATKRGETQSTRLHLRHTTTSSYFWRCADPGVESGPEGVDPEDGRLSRFRGRSGSSPPPSFRRGPPAAQGSPVQRSSARGMETDRQADV